MSYTTDNYEFTVPEIDDIPDISVLSQNWYNLDEILNGIDTRNKIETASSTVDLNGYTEQGIYRFTSSHTPTNVPSGCTEGWLFVVPWNNAYEAVQFWLNYADRKVYIRKRVYPTWGEWNGLTTSAELSDIYNQLHGAIESNTALIVALQAAIGSPLVASSAESMTDQTKVYVYTGTTTSTLTNGHWYYYDNGWTDGGVYNSFALETDKTLSIPDMAADAETVGDELTDLKSALDVTISDKNVTLGNSTRGHWVISNNIASLSEQSSGSYFAYSAIEVVPGGRYTVVMRSNSGHVPVILANYNNNVYNVFSQIAVESDAMRTFTINIPNTDVTHLLLTKYGTGYQASVTYLVEKTDKTLSKEDEAADSKIVGDKFAIVESNLSVINDIIEDELFEKITINGSYLVQGYIKPTGDCDTTSNSYLYKIDVTGIIGEEINAFASKWETSSSSVVLFGFYDILYADITRSNATAEHCVGIGNVYSTGAAENKIETLTVPVGAKTLLIANGKNSTVTAHIEYNTSIDIKSKIIKKSYESGNIFFTVDCPRPIQFGDENYNQSNETIECVLRLPASYKMSGKPTRLVLACHGSSGYIDSQNDVWYNSNWDGFMKSLTSAGYAVFDANIFSGNDTDVIGFALGSPLYAQVLKRAYDYITDNYNVYPHIFAHGTSMGGVGAKTFTHFYPKLVLAQSSFAGRDICKYLNLMNVSAGTLPYSGRMSVAYGYENDAALYADHFSHCVGMSDSLGIFKIQNGTIVLPPDRETQFSDWVSYYAELNNKSQSSDLTQWIGKSEVPYKAWNAWNDEEGSTAQEILMANAYAKTNSAPYYAVSYTLTNEEIEESTAHTKISYGQVRNMRNQLIAWFKRWE